MTKREYFLRILILGFLTALGPFSIDMYLPGFTAIAKDLHTSVNEVSLSLASYFIGLAAGQLLYGPLLDRFGRKKPLYIGLLVYIAASLGCIFVVSINQLIALRLLQALGSCAAAVTSVAMVRDLFPVEDNAKVFSLLMLVVGLSPLAAPGIGGFITDAFGWRFVFVILMAIALFILIASVFRLPSGYEPDTSLSLKPGPILKNFIKVMLVPQFYTYAFVGSLAFAGLFAYVAASPMVFMTIFGFSKKGFSLLFAGMSVAFIGSSQLNTLALRKYTSEQLIFAALSVQVIAGIVFVVLAMYNLPGLVTVIAFVFLFLCCLGFISSNASALTMAPFSKNGGSASALMGAIQLGMGSLATLFLGIIKSYSLVPLAAIMAVASTLGFIILLIGRRTIKDRVEAKSDTIVLH
jgi:DHA1 family bicyclomycin/chloramphenicol resistance-like MFS transporter